MTSWDVPQIGYGYWPPSRSFPGIPQSDSAAGIYRFPSSSGSVPSYCQESLNQPYAPLRTSGSIVSFEKIPGKPGGSNAVGYIVERVIEK